MSTYTIDESDLEATERWFAATLSHCHKLRDQQRHDAASNSAHGALKMFRTLRATEAVHGFFADLLIAPYEGKFEEFAR